MWIYSQGIGMEFGIVMKSDKRCITEGVELPNQEKIITLGEKETNKYLGILEADTIKQVETREKIKKSISEELENYSRQNSNKGINTSAVLLVIYSRPFLKWTRELK